MSGLTAMCGRCLNTSKERASPIERRAIVNLRCSRASAKTHTSLLLPAEEVVACSANSLLSEKVVDSLSLLDPVTTADITAPDPSVESLGLKGIFSPLEGVFLLNRVNFGGETWRSAKENDRLPNEGGKARNDKRPKRHSGIVRSTTIERMLKEI